MAEPFLRRVELPPDRDGRPRSGYPWTLPAISPVAGPAQVVTVADLAFERLPDYFPVDDAHPRRAMRPYGLSKRLGEDLCEGFTRRTGIATVCLRPVAVWDEAQYGHVRHQWRIQPRSEWEPYWEYGAFVDVRDVAAAVEQALTVPLDGHHRALLCATSIAATAPAVKANEMRLSRINPRFSSSA